MTEFIRAPKSNRLVITPLVTPQPSRPVLQPVAPLPSPPVVVPPPAPPALCALCASPDREAIDAILHDYPPRDPCADAWQALCVRGYAVEPAQVRFDIQAVAHHAAHLFPARPTGWHRHPRVLQSEREAQLQRAAQPPHQQPPLLVILRGAPGAGKSTWAQAYRAHWGLEVQCVSATDYFLTIPTTYRFDASLLGASHTYCAAAFRAALRAQMPRILLDNTNIRACEYRPYVDMALEQDYRVYQRVFTGTYANTSGVPAAQVARMRRTFEADTTMVHYVDDHCTVAPKRRQRQRPVPAAPQ